MVISFNGGSKFRLFMTDIFILPSDASACQLGTHCTDCGACTTPAAFNAASESRLLAAVDRAPDVARGPRASREGRPLQTKVSPSAERRLFFANKGPPES